MQLTSDCCEIGGAQGTGEQDAVTRWAVQDSGAWCGPADAACSDSFRELDRRWIGGRHAYLRQGAVPSAAIEPSAANGQGEGVAPFSVRCVPVRRNEHCV